MMADKIPHNALVVVADGAGARLFRNSGDENRVSFSADGEFRPTNLLDDGPAGRRPKESTNQETDEATFARQLTNELYRRAHHGDFAAPCPHRRPTDLGPNPPNIAQGGLESTRIRGLQSSHEGIHRKYPERIELDCPWPFATFLSEHLLVTHVRLSHSPA
jgi:Bacterial archaeo-eukaryotic release factor family 12